MVEVEAPAEGLVPDKTALKALKSSPGFETESQGELNPQTILECGSGSESRSTDPAPRRGRTRARGAYSGISTQKTALQAKEADQSSDKSSASALLVAMKFKKGHKRSRSNSRSNSRDRRKCHSGPSGSEDTVPSSEETVIPEQPKLSSSATQNIGPKASGAVALTPSGWWALMLTRWAVNDPGMVMCQTPRSP